MLIILEGLDKTGKSTLAAKLVELTGAELIHRSRPERHPIIEYESDLDDYVPGSGRHVVCDRWHWGELVWPTIYERPTLYTPEMFLHTEMYLQSRGALLVYASASAESIISRLDDSYPPPEKVQPALDLFADVYQRSRLPRGEYDFAVYPKLDETAASLIQSATMVERWATRETPHWVGDPHPSVLLVGDRPGPSDPTQATVPFRPFGGAAVYLLRAIEELEPRVALTNASDGDNDVPLVELWLGLNRPRVVALGGAADGALRETGVPHGVVPHPQWVRRFHHRRLPEYPDLIRRAARTEEDLRKETRTW